MCIRDRHDTPEHDIWPTRSRRRTLSDCGSHRRDRGDVISCLLYTSDAADERSSVDLGGRRIIKKKKHITYLALPYNEPNKL